MLIKCICIFMLQLLTVVLIALLLCIASLCHVDEVHVLMFTVVVVLIAVLLCIYLCYSNFCIKSIVSVHTLMLQYLLH